ncbi:MAG TPA: M48 family metallopeptidase [Gemmataceae bacterium]|nr:M48 family metallopeptidase [Gemmataceae bacterium]
MAGPFLFRFRLRPWCSAVLLCAAFGAALACSGGEPGQGEGPGHRAQTLGLSPGQELQLGRQAQKQILTNPDKYGRPLPDNSPEVQRVRRVAERIIRAAEIEPLQREMNLRKGYKFEWDVHVLNKNVVNAFCLPGGKIFVYTGILRIIQDDDQLATVLAHEIGHALAHHSSERIAHDQMNGGSGGIWDKAFDRAQESEADHIGLFLMTFAGYDPDEAVRFWQRMERLSSGRAPPEILSDHPSDEHRIRDIEAWLPKAKAAKRAFDEGRIAPAPRS